MFTKKKNKALRVLLVEDNPTDAEIAQRTLERYRRAEFDVVTVPSIKSCKKELKQGAFDVVLLDYLLEGETGLDLLRCFDGNLGLPPVIMMTGQTDVLVARDSILFGAHNYLVKDLLKPEVLGDTIREAIQSAGLEQEVGARTQDLQRIAFIDQLTGLYNRRYLDHAIEKECARATRYGGALSCMMLDLDDFKSHNDKFGHPEGDALLRNVAAVIRAGIRDSDIATRYGGDEFCIILPETDQEGATGLAERLRFGIASMHVIVGRERVLVTASIGVFTPPSDREIRALTVLERADILLRKAKARGKNQVCVEDSGLEAAPVERPIFGR